MNPLLLIHGAVTLSLVGLIWTIQVVHYPLFREVGPERFIAYHQRHMALISRVVGPLMLAEIGTAAWLLFLGERSTLFLISLAALAVNWTSTWFYQVPLHRKLASGYDASSIRRLVQTNVWRTAGWTIRGICVNAVLQSRLS